MTTPIDTSACDMMRHAISHDGRNYYCADKPSAEWGWWSGLVVLGLARFGNIINDGRSQYFHVTDEGRAYLRRLEAKS